MKKIDEFFADSMSKSILQHTIMFNSKTLLPKNLSSLVVFSLSFPTYNLYWTYNFRVKTWVKCCCFSVGRSNHDDLSPKSELSCLCCRQEFSRVSMLMVDESTQRINRWRRGSGTKYISLIISAEHKKILRFSVASWNCTFCAICHIVPICRGP